MDFAASAAKKRSAPLGKQRSIFPGNTLGQMQPVPCARPLPEAPAPPGSGCTGRFYWGGKIFRPCGEQFAPKGWGYVPPGHTQPGQRKCPSAGQPACGEQFARHNGGCAPPGHTQPGPRKCPICRAASLRGAVLAQRLWICPTRPPQKASSAKQKRHPDRMPFCLVRITGLEPAQYCYH